jgi:hypothetical protein
MRQAREHAILCQRRSESRDAHGLVPKGNHGPQLPFLGLFLLEEPMTNTWQMSPTTGSPVLVRLGAVALAVSGWLFFLYPVIRPWRNESTISGAVASMSSDAWVAAHLFAVFALILMPLGQLGLCRQLAGSRGYGLMLTGTVAVWLGAGLALPYYGAEDFALHALARQVRSGTSLDLVRLVVAVRFGAAATGTFAAGLVLLGVGGVLIAISIWRTAVLPRFSGVPLAFGLVIFIPQFTCPLGRGSPMG